MAFTPACPYFKFNKQSYTVQLPLVNLESSGRTVPVWALALSALSKTIIIMIYRNWMASLVVACLVLPSFFITKRSPPETEPFKLVVEKEGIRAFERWHAPPNGRPYRELKAVFRVQAKESALLAALREEQKAMLWMQNVAQFQVLPGGQNSHWRAYIRYGLPWPARDHDCVVSYQWARPAEGRAVATFQSARLSTHPPQEGVHRIQGLSGRWEFLAQADGRYEVAYYIMTTEASPIPRFVLDPIVRSNLLKTMAAFRQVAGSF